MSVDERKRRIFVDVCGGLNSLIGNLREADGFAGYATEC